MSRFAGTGALVTGAASGIGAATARALHEEGAEVVLADLDGDGAAAAAAALGSRARGSSWTSEKRTRCGVRSERAWPAAASACSSTPPASARRRRPETSLETWEAVLAVNARGTFLCCKHAIPAMAQSGGGAIVNVASVADLVGLRNRAAYCASKGAVVALTRALAVDHGRDGVRVNAVCPGTVDTPWVRRLVDEAGESLDELRARQPLGRLGTAEEITAAILYLASEAAAFVTGTLLVADGGLTAA